MCNTFEKRNSLYYSYNRISRILFFLHFVRKTEKGLIMRVSLVKKIVFFVLPVIMFSVILYYNCDTNPKSPGGNTNPTFSTVSIVQSSKTNASDLDYNDILTMVTKAVNLVGGFDELIQDGDTVILKVNLVIDIDYTLPEWDGVPLNPEANGCCTDYRVTRAVAELVRAENPTGLI
jgi:hypothetical protein